MAVKALGASGGKVTPGRNVRRGPSSSSPLYMVASNRFNMATDWGNGTSGFASGGSAQGINGGNGTMTGRYQSVRRVWRTANWTNLGPGRWLFANAAMSAVNVFEGLFSITIQRMEIRKLSDLSLAYVVTFGGAGSATIDPAGRLVSDVGPALLPNTDYTMDLWYTAPDNAAWPSQLPNTLAGEKVNSHNTNNLSLSAMAGENISNVVGGVFGPVAYVAQGWDGTTPVGLMFGDSILDHSNAAPFFAANGNFGHAQQAYGNLTDPWSYVSGARYSANFNAVYDNNAGGYGGKNQVDIFADLFALIPGQGSRPCMNHVFSEHNRNNLSGSATLTQFQGLYSTFATKVRSRWPNIPIVQTTVTPSTTVAAGVYKDFSEANQTPAGAGNTNGGAISQIRDYINANTSGAITRWLGVDAAQDCHGVTFGKWPVPAFSTTLVDAVAAGVNAYRLTDAPPIGALLQFEPGVNGKVETGNRLNVVRAVTANGNGGFDVTTTGGSRNSNAEATDTSYGGRTLQAHAAGVVVREIASSDLVHPAHAYTMKIRDRIIARKADIRTHIAAYNSELLAMR